MDHALKFSRLYYSIKTTIWSGIDFFSGPKAPELLVSVCFSNNLYFIFFCMLQKLMVKGQTSLYLSFQYNTMASFNSLTV